MRPKYVQNWFLTIIRKLSGKMLDIVENVFSNHMKNGKIYFVCCHRHNHSQYTQENGAALQCIFCCVPVLKPNFNLSLCETQLVGHFYPSSSGEVVISVELLLQL